MISLHGIILRKATQEDIDDPYIYIQTNGKEVTMLGYLNGLLLQKSNLVLTEIINNDGTTIGYEAKEKWW